MPIAIKEIFQTILEENRDTVEAGDAFPRDISDESALDSHLYLLSVLRYLNLSTASAEIGFWRKYNQSKVRTLQTQVKYYLGVGSIDQALIQAKHIKGQQKRHEALSAVAIEHINRGHLEQARDILKTLHSEGDLVHFGGIYEELARYCRAHEMSQQLEYVIQDFEQIVANLQQDSERRYHVEILLLHLEEIRNPKPTIFKDKRYEERGFTDRQTVAPFHLPESDLLPHLQSELESLKNITPLHELEKKARIIVTSISVHIRELETWQQCFPLLLAILEHVYSQYLIEKEKFIDEDGQLKGKLPFDKYGNSVLTGNAYFGMKLELAYTAARLGDTTGFSHLINEHFIFSDVIELFRRPLFQDLYDKALDS